MGLKQKPYNLFIYSGVLFFLMSLFPLGGESTIHLHDMYFVIYHAHILRIFACLSLLFWLLYLVTHKILFSGNLTSVHVIITLFTLIIFSVPIYFGRGNGGFVSRKFLDTWAIIILILLSGQVLFLANLIFGFFKRGLSNKVNPK